MSSHNGMVTLVDFCGFRAVSAQRLISETCNSLTTDNDSFQLSRKPAASLFTQNDNYVVCNKVRPITLVLYVVCAEIFCLVSQQ
jgi:hypothetical protein